jgi:hypothetical protein
MASGSARGQLSGDRERGEAGRGGSPPISAAAIASAAKPGAAGRRRFLPRRVAADEFAPRRQEYN